MRRLLAALLAAGGLTVASPAASACACGGLLDQPGGDTSVGAETSVVVWDGASETIVLRLSTRSEAVTAGLLVPTPSPATVDLGDDQMFADLVDVIAPRHEKRWRLFGPPLFGGGGEEGTSAGGPVGAGVEVLGTVELGPLRVTTISAANPTALDNWLRANNFQATPGLTNGVKPYVDHGWSFVAVQLNSVGQTLEGDLPPIEMIFPSDAAVYPMRMSSVAEDTQQPRVYVLAKHRMQRTDPVASGATRPETLFAGPVSPTDVSSPVLKEWLTTTPYLTATTQWLPDPGRIVSDFIFAQAPDDTPYQVVIYDDSHLVPGDVGAVLILLMLAGAVWLAVRLVRR